MSLICVGVLVASLVILGWRRRPSGVMAVILSASGVFLPLLWEWGRTGEYRWSGVPGRITLASEQTAMVQGIFATAAAACIAVTILIAFRGPTLTIDHFRNAGNLLIAPRTLRSTGYANSSVMLVWLVGQGPSVLHRTSYLATDGVTFALRLSLAFLLPLLVVNAAIAARCDVPSGVARRLVIWQVLWAVLATATGSRIGMIALALLAGALACRGRARPTRATAVAVVCALMALVSVGHAHAARGSVHGVLPLAEATVNGDMARMAAPTETERAVRGVAASLGASSAVVAITTSRPLTGGQLAALANPLPRSLGGGGQDLAMLISEHQYLLPMTWVPTAAIGEMYAVGGLTLIFVVFLMLAWMSDALHALVRRRLVGHRLAIPSVLFVYGLALFTCFGSIQYAGRQFWRLVSIEFALLAAVAIFARSHPRSSSPPDTLDSGLKLFHDSS